MTSSDANPDASPEVPRRTWWQEPYVHLGISILMAAAAQLLMKRGATESIGDAAVFGFRGLTSGWIWLGILAHIASLMSWLYALRFAALNIANNLTGLIQVLVPLGAWIFLGEEIQMQRWGGILLICVGVVITARQVRNVEEKL